MNESTRPAGMSPCDEVQDVLLDYLNRELGPARSQFVREHVRRCERCRAAMAELSETIAVLNLARKAPAPDRLSPERRRLMQRAVLHPVIDWILRHNRTVAVVCTVVLLAGLILLARWAMDIEEPDISGAVPVNLSNPETVGTGGNVRSANP